MLNKHTDLPISSGYSRRQRLGGILGVRENFSKNLSRILKAKGISQAKLAEALGITQGSISGWITLRDWPTPENVDRVVAFLGVHSSDLFGDDSERRPEDEFLEAIRAVVSRGGFKIQKS